MASPHLLAISDRRARRGRSLTDWLAALEGVDAVLLREKHLDDRALFDAAIAARAALGDEVLLLVSGRLDVALAAGAGGVHLPADGVPAALLRRRFGRRVVIGCSTHRPSEVAAARDAGADFVTFGPVFDTPSKRRYGPPAGLAGLRRAAACGIPVLALGGIDATRYPAVIAAGAAGVAGIRVFHRQRRRRALLDAARRHPG
ncbi:MAG: thiamine phosphate synthase [Acidobacteria bacterium]|nr:MAG: thiamine phosphate synthase [Acidobacteriota bacterium]